MTADRLQSVLYAAANGLAGSVLTLLVVDADRYLPAAVVLCVACVACYVAAARVGRQRDKREDGR
jgi:hypothetical protein